MNAPRAPLGSGASPRRRAFGSAWSRGSTQALFLGRRTCTRSSSLPRCCRTSRAEIGGADLLGEVTLGDTEGAPLGLRVMSSCSFPRPRRCRCRRRRRTSEAARRARSRRPVSRRRVAGRIAIGHPLGPVETSSSSAPGMSHTLARLREAASRDRARVGGDELDVDAREVAPASGAESSADRP